MSKKKIRRRRKAPKQPHTEKFITVDQAGLLQALGGLEAPRTQNHGHAFVHPPSHIGPPLGLSPELRRLAELDLSPQGNEKFDLVRELLRLGREVLLSEEAAGVDVFERTCFLTRDGKPRPRIREIGERLWDLNKDDDPGRLHWVFQCDLLSIPSAFHGELATAWDGVGNFRR